MMGNTVRLTVASALLLLPLAQGLRAQESTPAGNYFWNTLGLAGDGPSSYVDKGAGDDMLPYTADDVDLPALGNLGGTWSLAHFDNNSDGKIQDDEHIFTVTRRGDDDALEISSLNRPEYGVLYESEDWWDYHDARNQGASKNVPYDPGDPSSWLDASGSDFEHNDNDAWDGESNAFLYNNARANQHGEGKPRYYFELINPSNTDAIEGDWVYDEVEGYEKTFNFQANYNDPATPEDERGPCRRWHLSTKSVVKGYLIPVADLAGLADGSLESPFGWETVDLAAYFRDTIGPKLEDENLTIYPVDAEENGYDPATILPPTHILLYQLEMPVSPNGAKCGGNDDAARQTADLLWGVPAEGATYRSCQILGFNTEAHNTATAGVHRPWLDSPDDGAELNLWLLDHFFRDDTSHLGKYTFAGPAETTWSIADDPEGLALDNTKDRILLASGGGAVKAPLPKALGADERPVVVVDLADDEAGAGLSTVQIGLHSAEGVIAYVELKSNQVSIEAGGTLDAATGLIGGPTKTESVATNPAFGGVNLDPLNLSAEYTRFVVQVTEDKIRVIQHADGAYTQNDFNDLGVGGTVFLEAALGGGGGGIAFAGGLASVSVYGSASFAITTVAVFAGLPLFTSFIRGDSNCDGKVDISDAVYTLGFLFLGGEAPCCAEVTNANGDANVPDLSDAVYTLGHLFLGTAAPPAPFPACGGAGCPAHPCP
ncbi:MAG: hypothetical protein HY721_29005 [Planctomycetes bacterium]|nr:hypothetical protein [Planctomycetota bacterium]